MSGTATLGGTSRSSARISCLPKSMLAKTVATPGVARFSIPCRQISRLSRLRTDYVHIQVLIFLSDSAPRHEVQTPSTRRGPESFQQWRCESLEHLRGEFNHLPLLLAAIVKGGPEQIAVCIGGYCPRRQELHVFEVVHRELVEACVDFVQRLTGLLEPRTQLQGFFRIGPSGSFGFQ
jgi:hypothetical protein